MTGQDLSRVVSEKIRRIERLFTSDILSIASTQVKSYGVKAFGGAKFRLFIFYTANLINSAKMLFVLDVSEGGGDQAISLLPPDAAAGLTALCRESRATVVWYVSERLSGVTEELHENYRLYLSGADEIFERLITLPTAFSLMAGSEVDVSAPAFTNRYLERLAIDNQSYVQTDTAEREQRSETVLTLDQRLDQWADSDEAELPILLLGDRGSGKTWQLLRFCQRRFDQCHQTPWLHPPALYLSLRGASEILKDAQRASLGLYGMFAERYSWFSVRWTLTMFLALLERQRLVLCLDGLDEIEMQPSEASIGDHFRRVVTMVPRGSRLLLSARTTHFASFEQLNALETWPGLSVRSSFQTFRLSPFRHQDVIAYSSSVATEDLLSQYGRERLRDIVGGSSGSELTWALRRCCNHPGIASAVVNQLEVNDTTTEFELLQCAIEGSLVFNLEAERTRPLLVNMFGEMRIFGKEARCALLGEIAWFMSERKLAAIDLDRLPRRLTRVFGIDNDRLKWDIRSQMVFELADSNKLTAERVEAGGVNDPEIPSYSTSLVRFAFGRDVSEGQGVNGADDVRREMGAAERLRRTSVAESYFLSFYIATRLLDSERIPGVMPEDTLQYLGRLRLSTIDAAMLRERIGRDQAGQLATTAKRHLVAMAMAGGCRVFSRSTRFLMENLERLGLVDQDERRRFDPWTPELIAVTHSPTGLEEYELILVPAPSSEKIASRVYRAGSRPTEEPFLLGLHEVTNSTFETFLCSEAGGEWSVKNVTRAGRDSPEPLPSLASRTNEYHLYHWDYDSREDCFRPPAKNLRHPVVYVSLYVAEAFCDWVSTTENRYVVYGGRPRVETGHTAQISGQEGMPGFRLPTAMEWWWAAHGANDTLDCPWELLPYNAPVPSSDDDDSPLDIADPVTWFQLSREAARAVLLDSGARSAEVAYDEDVGPFGVIGLNGNVKEWVDDIVREGSQLKALVCGGTAHLGAASFRTAYYATLFPENTNPDVGFRIARSLSVSEFGAFRARETELSSLATELSIEPIPGGTTS